jgi:hypothetical protein
LELKASGARALRLEKAGRSAGDPGITESEDSVNIIAGYGLNSVAPGVIGATIGGGGNTYCQEVFRELICDDRPNQAIGDYATIGGGAGNSAGTYATVPGGSDNIATGPFSFAAGSSAGARHEGTFVWNDRSIESFASTAPNQFLIHASGGVGINTPSPAATLDVQSPDQATIRLVSSTLNGSVIELKNLSDSSDYLGAINFNDKDGTYPGQIGYHANGDFTFRAKNVTVPVLTITGGADVAEPFQMSRKDIPKGSSVVIDEDNPGQLKLSDRAYDKGVAGILSGANGIKAGICLSQEGFNSGGQNVALSGRVYALADASGAAIKPGDLLTTSDTPGHCMKVTDHARAQGAIIGKAMSSLKEGKGMVLVLVSLQ